MGISLEIEGRCSLDASALEAAILASPLAFDDAENWRDVRQLASQDTLLSILPIRDRVQNGFIDEWLGLNPLGSRPITTHISLDVARGGHGPTREIEAIRLASWLIANAPGEWMLFAEGRGARSIALVHARGETVLFHEFDWWRRGDYDAPLQAVSVHYRFGDYDKNERKLVWQSDPTAPNYSRLADLLMQLRERLADDGEDQPRRALASKIAAQRELLNELDHELPQDLTVLLSLADGIEWDGLVLYGTGSTDGVMSLTDANLTWRDVEGLPHGLIIGETDMDVLIALHNGEGLTADKVSGDVAERWPSVLTMLETVIEARLP